MFQESVLREGLVLPRFAWVARRADDIESP